MSILALEHEMPRAARTSGIGDDYRRMAKLYQERCKSSPGSKRAVIAAQVAAEVFGISLDELKSQSRRAGLVWVRLRVMAFAKLVSGRSTYEVGRVVNRGHVAAMRAYRKHGGEIAAALGVEHEPCE